ncbi:MAG: N-6 DNA methylase [Candidatus Delongbacteria bacterium]|nr:N-6 DNA methylase [Candidatus Delongbacteria bacterium]MCG2760462.1 N-6 DNA methylase [Candidatus Delongbacteria bacterium]
MKGVYQELIDLDTRHSLGEYYTPDWLCERIVKKFDFKPTDKVLDPACGSGSFLRAFVHRIREVNPGISVEDLNNNVYGIDIHPLSVQIAKTTLLLSLGREITKIRKPIHLNVILANTLTSPKGAENLFDGDFLMFIEKIKLWLNIDIFEDMNLFDDALDTCDDLADQTMNKKAEGSETIANILKNINKDYNLEGGKIESFYKIYQALKTVKEKGRDSIWKFIIQNSYKPFFLKGKFNYVIGNPPWFTYSSIRNEEYQSLLNQLSVIYDLKPSKVANFPHLEIAAIFMSHCSSYFLKKDGKLAFVLPRSFFNADHHDNTRSGKAKGFKITDIWDLEGVSPLFRIPSCVLFSDKADFMRALPETGAEGISFSGNIPVHNCTYSIAEEKLTEVQNNYYYIKQGKSSAFSIRNTIANMDENPYKALFRQGATIVPRAFYFIELTQETPDDWENRIINIKTSEDIQTDAKAPWKGIDYSGKIESRFLFRTALSKSILPFALYKPALVALPLTIVKTHEKKIQLHTADELLTKGYLQASRWFKNAENIWAVHRTENNKKVSLEDYLNWQTKLTTQNINAPYLVLYNSSAKDANATVVKRQDLDLEFVVESVTYVFYTNDLNEAYYLSGIFNSSVTNLLMKDFQAKGLFGPRHVHKKILDIFYPKYDENDPKHNKLAKLSEAAHKKTSEFLETIDKDRKIQGLNLGKLRLEIKMHLEKELERIDEIVKGIVG